MLVTHLYHSGVLVETDYSLLLFDYYKGDLNLSNDKPLYIFVSHNHKDHFNTKIFDIKHPNKTYILSHDIKTQYPAIKVEPHKKYKIDNMVVETLQSTDVGVAFIATVDDKTIYHAGDLHWWHWKDEEKNFNDYQKRTYQNEINSINKKIDLACIVIDSRLEEYYLLGLEYFLKHVNSKYILPIHYFGNYDISQSFQKEKPDNKYQACILNVKHSNQKFNLL